MMPEFRIPPEKKLHILTKLLEQEYGYDKAHQLIDRAEIEYAVLETNKVLEKR